MSGFVLNALSTAGNIGYWGLRQLVHSVEINRSGPWVYPQALSKVACLAAAYLAYHAPSNDLKKAYIACSLASLVANYAFRQVFLSDLIVKSKDKQIATLKGNDKLIATLQGDLKEAKEKNRSSSESSEEQFLDLNEKIDGLQASLNESEASEEKTAEANQLLLKEKQDLINVNKSLAQELAAAVLKIKDLEEQTTKTS